MEAKCQNCEIVQEPDAFKDMGLDGIEWGDSLEEQNSPIKEEAGENASWHIRINYTNNTWQDISCYDGQLAIENAEELYFQLLEYFEPEDDRGQEKILPGKGCPIHFSISALHKIVAKAAKIVAYV